MKTYREYSSPYCSGCIHNQGGACDIDIKAQAKADGIPFDMAFVWGATCSYRQYDIEYIREMYEYSRDYLEAYGEYDD